MEYKVGDYFVLGEFAGEIFVITRVAEGGFGKVLLVMPTTFGLVKEPLAIKQIKDIHNIDQLKREALLWSRMSASENIATFYGIGELDGSIYIASKRYNKTLSDISIESISAPIAVGIFKGIVSGLLFANSNVGLIHKDIKPDNIFLEGWTPKIGDFGLSDYLIKIVRNSFTKGEMNESIHKSSGLVGGTFPFMAPELFEQSDPIFTLQTDIFAVGVTVFILLSGGMFPFHGDNKTLDKISIQAFFANTSKKGLTNLQEIVFRCIDPDINNRYNAYEEILHDLRGFIESNQPQNHVSNEIATTINNIQSLRRAKRYNEALNVLTEAEKKYPQYPLLVNQMALLLLEVEHKNDAIRVLRGCIGEQKYEKVLYIEPAMNFCNMSFECGSIASLIAVFENYLVEIDKNKTYYSRFYYEIGLYYTILGDYETAIKYLRDYICNSPNNRIANCAFILSSIEYKKIKECILLFSNLTIEDNGTKGLIELLKDESEISGLKRELHAYKIGKEKNNRAASDISKKMECLNWKVINQLMFFFVLNNIIFDAIIELYVIIKKNINTNIKEISTIILSHITWIIEDQQSSEFEIECINKFSIFLINNGVLEMMPIGNNNTNLSSILEIMIAPNDRKRGGAIKSLKTSLMEYCKEKIDKNIIDNNIDRLFESLVANASIQTKMRCFNGKYDLSNISYLWAYCSEGAFNSLVKVISLKSSEKE